MATVSSPLITIVEESLEDILSSSIVKWINSTDFDLESTCASTEVYSSFSQDSTSSLCCNGWNYAWLDEECILCNSSSIAGHFEISWATWIGRGCILQLATHSFNCWNNCHFNNKLIVTIQSRNYVISRQLHTFLCNYGIIVLETVKIALKCVWLPIQNYTEKYKNKDEAH